MAGEPTTTSWKKAPLNNSILTPLALAPLASGTTAGSFGLGSVFASWTFAGALALIATTAAALGAWLGAGLEAGLLVIATLAAGTTFFGATLFADAFATGLTADFVDLTGAARTTGTTLEVTLATGLAGTLTDLAAGLAATLVAVLTEDPFWAGCFDATLAAGFTGALATVFGAGLATFAAGLATFDAAPEDLEAVFTGAFLAGTGLAAGFTDLGVVAFGLETAFTGALLFESFDFLDALDAEEAFLSGPLFFLDLDAIRN